MGNEVLIWLAIFVIAVFIEVSTMGLTSIWFAGGALVAIVADACNASFMLQIYVFLGVSFLMLFFTRPVAVKYFNKSRCRTNVESMIGKQAIVISEIDNMQGVGQVKIGGIEWSARSDDEQVRIAVGTVVKIVDVNGVKLIVRDDSKEE